MCRAAGGSSTWGAAGAAIGHEVYEAADGPTGVPLVLRLRPDVTLVDVGLPGLDGYEVARRLRAAADSQALYLIAVTGYGACPEIRSGPARPGFDSHLVKPVHPGQMIAVLRDLRAT